MAYLGKTPSQAVRSRYYFTASGGETSLAPAQVTGLSFTDANYVDVSLNGVALVSGTDYTATPSTNTISSLSALTASDVVEIVVYDTFSVFGGNVNGDFNISGGDLTLGDNDKAIFGAGSDLQIYHDGSNSYITEGGDQTGDLFVRASNLKLTNASGDFFLWGRNADSVRLYHNNAQKLETTSTGVDVTGNINVGDNHIIGDDANDNLTISSSSDEFVILEGAKGILARRGASDTNAIRVGVEGDISFYADDGTTQGLFWDASTQRLGLGTTAPAERLHVFNGSSGRSSFASNTDLIIEDNGNSALQFASPNTNVNAIYFSDPESNTAGVIQYSHITDAMSFDTNDTTRMTIDSSGTLLVGKTSEAIGTAGAEFRASGHQLNMTRASGPALNVNRLSSSGELVGFYQDTAQFGQITCFTTGGVDYLQIGTTGANKSGLIFETNRIYTTVNGSVSGSTVDLGTDSVPFKHLELSGFTRSRGTYPVFTGADVLGSTGGITSTGSNPLVIGTDGTERMRIDSSGRLIMGATSMPTNGGIGFEGGSGYAQWSRSGTSSEYAIRFFRNNSNSGNISYTSTSVTYGTSSDHRLKENVADMTGAITRVKQLAPKRFNFIADDSVTVDGFLAHEAQTVVPEAITGTHNEVDADGNPVMQGIDQSKLVPLLTGALQEAIAKIETLETQRADLEARLTALENA